MLSLITAVMALLYFCMDINYFLRLVLTIWYGRLFQKNCHINDVTTIYGFCSTQDIDILLSHMNNARYLRELDFARYDFFDRTGIYANLKAVNGCILQGASNIRYRRTIPIFSLYKIETKLVYWHEKTFFLEQKFITINDGFVRAINLSRQHLLNINADKFFEKIIGTYKKPECPKEIKCWLDSIELSSALLRSVRTDYKDEHYFFLSRKIKK